MKFKKVTHVIFDMDGLLLDTEPLYTVAINKICNQYGKEYLFEHKLAIMGTSQQFSSDWIVKTLELPITSQEFIDQLQEQYKILMANPALMPVDKNGSKYPEEMKLKVLGKREKDIAKFIVKELSLKCTEEKFLHDYRDLYLQELDKATLMTGAERLIKHLHKHNIPIAVATSSARDSVAIKTKNHQNLFVLFGHLVSGSSDPEVKNSKPAPDIFLVCASKFPKCPEPSSCLVFEDAPNGVQAAVAAGMQVVMVPDPRIPDDKKAQATQVLHSLEEFKPEDFGLPPFPKCNKEESG